MVTDETRTVRKLEEAAFRAQVEWWVDRLDRLASADRRDILREVFLILSGRASRESDDEFPLLGPSVNAAVIVDYAVRFDCELRAALAQMYHFVESESQRRKLVAEDRLRTVRLAASQVVALCLSSVSGDATPRPDSAG